MAELGEMGSRELAHWLAFYSLELEAQQPNPPHEPTPLTVEEEIQQMKEFLN